ncbi:MAG: hypothetical protein WBA43_12790 [Elainellaceae cyanobacterium]
MNRPRLPRHDWMRPSISITPLAIDVDHCSAIAIYRRVGIVPYTAHVQPLEELESPQENRPGFTKTVSNGTNFSSGCETPFKNSHRLPEDYLLQAT